MPDDVTGIKNGVRGLVKANPAGMLLDAPDAIGKRVGGMVDSVKSAVGGAVDRAKAAVMGPADPRPKAAKWTRDIPLPAMKRRGVTGGRSAGGTR